MLTSQHFCRCLLDGLRLLAIQQPQRSVAGSGLSLQQYQRLDQGGRHALSGNTEILQAALRLRAPQTAGLDFYRAKTVLFDAYCTHGLPHNHGHDDGHVHTVCVADDGAASIAQFAQL